MVSLALWALAVWLVLTWTVTAEQLSFGAVLALAIGAAMAPLGEVVAPWRLVRPRRLLALARLIGYASVRVVAANVGLARRIWAPSRPLASGMVVVPSRVNSDATLGATGLITSLIVDNQIVDVDRDRHELQYHAVSVPTGSAETRAESINAPIERRIADVNRRP